MNFEINHKNEMLPFAIGTSKDEVLKFYASDNYYSTLFELFEDNLQDF